MVIRNQTMAGMGADNPYFYDICQSSYYCPSMYCPPPNKNGSISEWRFSSELRRAWEGLDWHRISEAYASISGGEFQDEIDYDIIKRQFRELSENVSSESPTDSGDGQPGGTDWNTLHSFGFTVQTAFIFVDEFIEQNGLQGVVDEVKRRQWAVRLALTVYLLWRYLA